MQVVEPESLDFFSPPPSPKTDFPYVALAVLELDWYPELRYLHYLCLMSAGIDVSATMLSFTY